MRDIDTLTYERARELLEALRSFLEDNGYGAISTPILEETELFVRKSGGDLAGRLYTFTDPGGHSVSLRPEFTSSVIRYFISRQESLSLPVRWQYGGPVFRYEPENDGGLRQFDQVGAEIVGAAGLEADAEIISLAWSGLERIGLKDFQIRVGHLGALQELLGRFGLSESARLFIIGNISALKSGRTNVESLRERAREVGLLRGGLDLGLETALENMSGEAAQEFVQTVLKESMPAPTGRRTAERIVARLLKKASGANDPDAFDSALALANQLAHLEGHPEDVLEWARTIATDGKVEATPFDRLGKLFDMLAERNVPEARTVVDLGLARGISYYTGVIFELMLDSPHELSVGGGGRYDGLVKALGGEEDIAAMGFAYNLDYIVSVLVSSGQALNRVTVDSQ